MWSCARPLLTCLIEAKNGCRGCRRTHWAFDVDIPHRQRTLRAESGSPLLTPPQALLSLPLAQATKQLINNARRRLNRRSLD